MTHLNPEEIMRLADDEGSTTPHLRECAACANAVLAEMQLRRAIRSAGRRYTAPDALRARVARDLGRDRRRWTGWLAIAAAAVLVVAVFAILAARRPADARELIDLHVMMLTSPNPVDVISTDRHTVKPWFEGRIPFAFDIPELGATSYRLVGGRVVYWQRHPGALLQLVRGGHRISLFVFRDALLPRSHAEDGFHMRAWRAHGLLYVLVADLPDEELAKIELLFG